MRTIIRNLLLISAFLLAAASCGSAQQIPAVQPVSPAFPCSFRWVEPGYGAQSFDYVCAAPRFTPPATVAFAGPGTYKGQYLGRLSGSPLSPGGKIDSVVLGGIDGIAVSNLSLSFTPPDGSTGNNSDQYVYGDVTVTNRAAVTAGLLLTLFQADTQVTSVLDVLQLKGGAPAGCIQDATASVKITTRPAVPLLGSDLWMALVTIKNTGTTKLTGPLELSLAGLSGNAALFGAAGTGTCPVNAGEPYQYVGAKLAPGESADVLVTFTNSQVPSAAISYTPKLLAGGSVL